MSTEKEEEPVTLELEEEKKEPAWHLPRIALVGEQKALYHRLRISNGDASKCYIQAFLPFDSEYQPTKKSNCIKQVQYGWFHLFGPLPYAEAVALWEAFSDGSPPVTH
jgi:hypothetical protein